MKPEDTDTDERDTRISPPRPRSPKKQKYLPVTEGATSIRLPNSTSFRNLPTTTEARITKFLKFSTPTDPSELLIDCVKSNYSDYCELLLIKGHLSKLADATYQSSHGRCALHFASEAGFMKICETLLLHGKYTTLDIVDKKGMTPLHLAARSNRVNIVRLLVRNGASLDMQDNLGNTALHYIASNRSIELFQYLLRRDADLRIVNHRGMTPIQAAKTSVLGD